MKRAKPSRQENGGRLKSKGNRRGVEKVKPFGTSAPRSGGSLLLSLCLLLSVPVSIEAQWVLSAGSEHRIAVEFAVKDSFVFAAAGGILRSADSGKTWIQVNSFAPGCFGVKGKYLFGGNNSGVFISSDNGESWAKRNSGLACLRVTCFLMDGENIYVGTDTGEAAIGGKYPPNAGGVFLSTDDGNTWTERDSGLTNLHVRALTKFGSAIFAGTATGMFVLSGVFRSTNHGAAWTRTDLQLAASSFVTVGGSLFAGSFVSGGVFRSTDSGETWRLASSGMWDSVYSGYYGIQGGFAVCGSHLFVGTQLHGVFLSTDLGDSWSQVNNDGFGSQSGSSDVFSIAVVGDYLLAGTGTGIYRRPLKEMITAIHGLSLPMPSEFKLNQNYPNPFNSSTVISYRLSVVSHVVLKVYDVLGREAASLVDEMETAGIHSVRFDGSNLPSGVYFYRVIADGIMDAKKMLLLR